MGAEITMNDGLTDEQMGRLEELDARSSTGLDDSEIEEMERLVGPSQTTDEQRNSALKFAIGNAPKDVAREANVFKLSSKIGASPEIVRHGYDQLEAAHSQSQVDAAKYRREHPGVAAMADQNPDLAPIIVADEKLTTVAKWFRQATVLEDSADKELDQLGWFDKLLTGLNPAAALRMSRKVVEEKDAEVVAAGTPRRVEYLNDERAKQAQALQGLDRWKVPFMVFEDARQGQKRLEVGFQKLMGESAGMDMSSLQSEVDALAPKRRDYGEAGEFEGMLSASAQLMSSQVESLSAMGLWGGTAAAVAGGVTLAATKSPAAAKKAALASGSAFAKAGVAKATLEMEAASFYLDTEGEKTDDGQEMDPDLRRFGAIAYGVISAGISAGTFGTQMAKFGPAGDAIASGNSKAFAKALMSDKRLGLMAKDAMKRWASGIASETKEEMGQKLAEDLTGYFAKSYQSGEWQREAINGEELLTTGVETIKGTILPGAVGAGSTIVQHKYAQQKSRSNGEKVRALAGLANSPTAIAAPEAVAKMIERESAKTGEPLTHVYVSPDAVQKLFQGAGDDYRVAAVALLGPDGPQQIDEAIRTDTKLEIPVADYLSKWGTKPIAEALLADTTTTRDGATENDTRVFEEANKARLPEVLARYEGGKESEAETRIFDALEKQLGDTNQIPRKELKAQMAPLRAFVETLSERMGEDADKVFENYAFAVQKEGQDVAASPAGAETARFNQTDIDIDEDAPGAAKALTQRFAEQSPEERKRSLFIDTTTGVLNERAFNRIPPNGRMVAAISIEGVKHENDSRGHEAGNNVYRAAARALSPHAPEIAKVKGDFAVYVKDQAELDGILEKANTDAGLNGFEIIGSVGVDRLDALTSNTKIKVAAEKSGTRAERGGRPKNAPQGDFVFSPDLVADTAITPELDAAFNAIAEDERAVFEETYTEAATGLLTKDGFDAIPRKAFQGAIDLNGLKEFNLELTDEGGDLILQDFGKLLTEYGGADFDAAHISGDEYAVQSDDEVALKKFLKKMEGLADRTRITLRDTATGSKVTIKGVSFGYGTGPDIHAAEGKLKLHKEQLEREGRGGPGVATARIVLGSEGDAEGRSEVQPGGNQSGREDSLPEARPQRYARKVKQRLNQTHRGFVEIETRGTGKTYRINLGEKANRSTFLHENGHVFLDILSDMAAREDSPASIKRDWQTTLAFLGVDSAQDIKREHHEKWAESFESYLMEGKSPSLEMRSVFKRFRMWLTNIYGKVPPQELSPEIREVFDRMLATDEEIARAKGQVGLDLRTFKTAEEAGMTPEQWVEHLELQADAASIPAKQAELRLMKELLRESEGWWKEGLETEKDKASAAFEAQPAQRAARHLRGQTLNPDGSVTAGKRISLDRAYVERELGKADSRRFQLSKDGEHPDAWADMFGFPTGAAMLKAIVELPNKEKWAADQADGAMREQHGDLLLEKNRLREIVESGVHGDHTGKWLVAEMKAVWKKAGGKGTAPTDAVKRAAEALVSRRTLRRLDPGRVLAAERRSAQNATAEAAKGNYAKAYVHLEQRLLNMHLYGELTKAREEREELLDLSAAMSKDRVRAKLGKASPKFRDGSDLIFETLGLADPREREETLPSFADVTKEIENADTTIGFDPEVIEKALAKKSDYRDLTVAEMREVVIALNALKGAARSLTTSIVDGKRIDKEQVIDQLIEAAEKNVDALVIGKLPSSKSAATNTQKAVSLIRTFDSNLLQISTVIHWLGGRERAGTDILESIWHKAFIQPMQEAKALKADIFRKVIQPLVEKFDKMPKSVRSRLSESVDGKALFKNHAVIYDQGLPPPSMRSELIMMVLHYGTESSKQRLLDGRNITAAEMDAVVGMLTKEEMDWIQSVWDASESLWEMSASLEERDSGLRPGKLKHRPIITQHGTYPGGYFPASYDSSVETQGARSEAEQQARLTDPTISRPGTNHNHLKARAQQFSGALALDPANIITHLAKVAHDIAFREAVKSVGGLAMSPRLLAVLNDRIGKERADQLLIWAKDSGRMTSSDDAKKVAGFTKAFRYAKGKSVIAILGYSASPALGDFSNLAVAVTRGDLKTKHMVPIALKFYANVIGAFARDSAHLKPGFETEMERMVMEKSGEMRSRRDGLPNELRKQLKQMERSGILDKTFDQGAMGWLKEHAFIFMEWSSRLTSTPIWIAGYEQGLAEGMDEAKAVRFADLQIQTLFPSSSPVDQAPILRNAEVGANIMFYGYFSVAYNLQHSAIRSIGNAEGASNKTKASAAYLATLFAMSVIGEILAGRGPEEDEDAIKYAMRKMAGFSLSTVALIGGEAAGAIESALTGKQANVRASPLVAMAQSVARNFMTATNEEKDVDKRVIAAISAASQLGGLPLNAPATKQGAFISKIASGEKELVGPLDAMDGLIYGYKAEGKGKGIPGMLSDVLEK